jgi:hypothetical protein
MDLKFCKCVIRKFSLFPAFYLKIKVKELPAMNSQGNPVSLYGNEAQALRYIAIIIFAYSGLCIGQNGLHSIPLYAPLLYMLAIGNPTSLRKVVLAVLSPVNI